jgi:hypothetical protein
MYCSMWRALQYLLLLQISAQYNIALQILQYVAIPILEQTPDYMMGKGQQAAGLCRGSRVTEKGLALGSRQKPGLQSTK